MNKKYVQSVIVLVFKNGDFAKESDAINAPIANMFSKIKIVLEKSLFYHSGMIMSKASRLISNWLKCIMSVPEQLSVS